MTKILNVNTSDIHTAIKLGCHTMSNVFNANDNEVPFFGSEVIPNPKLSFSNIHSESHVPGRHLNALLTAENVLDIDIDQSAVEKHEAAAALSYSGHLVFPLNRENQNEKPINLIEHNFREGFHALYALARYRNSEWAMEKIQQSIKDINKLWDPTQGWDKKTIKQHYKLRFPREHTFITGLARSIGPLVKIFRATGERSALDLAKLLASKVVEEFFQSNGAYDRQKFGSHTHSTTCVMSSLAQLADLTNDLSLIKRVKKFYDHGLWDIRDEIGWVIENSDPTSPPDRGECNNTGDILETALILGRRGYHEYYQDAERIIRGHLLPSQLRDNSFIKEPENPLNKDGLHEIAARHLGAFGFPAPYGHYPLDIERVSFNMDIVGGTVGSLCEAIREGITADSEGHKINLMFENKTPELFIKPNTKSGGISIVTKRSIPLWVRIPTWVDTNTLSVTGVEKHKIIGDYVFVKKSHPNKPIKLSYAVPTTKIILRHRTRKIRTELRGDTVIRMENFGANLTFFDPIDG